MTKPVAPTRIRVNPAACTGHGLCAELLPELITLDEWGYPVVSAEPVPAGLDRQARRAVTDCPALALLLTPAAPPADGQRPFRRNAEGAQRARVASRGTLDA
jgi:ferredoxin